MLVGMFCLWPSDNLEQHDLLQLFLILICRDGIFFNGFNFYNKSKKCKEAVLSFRANGHAAVVFTFLNLTIVFNVNRPSLLKR